MFDSGQGSLLDLPPDDPGAGDVPGGAVVTDLAPPTGLRRTELGDGAWFDLLPSWVPGSAALHARLVRSVGWRAGRRQMYDRVVDVPRLTAWFGEGDPLPDPALTAARDRLDAHYGALGPFRTAGLNLYRDGTDSVAWHADRVAREPGAPDALVAILSLGAARTLALRPAGGGPGRRLQLGHGDLFVMGGSFQRTWQHAVPRTARPVGARTSVQLRTWSIPRDGR